MNGLKRVIAALVALAALISLLPAAFAAGQPAAVPGTETKLSELRDTGTRESQYKNTYRYAEDETVRAIVLLKDAPAADVAFRDTRSAASRRTKVLKEQNSVLRSMKGIDFRLQFRYDTLLNGFCCDVAWGDLEAIAALDGVASVHVTNRYSVPAAETAPAARMPAANAAVGNDSVWGKNCRGEGTVIAVLDTGLRTGHEAFQDAGGICEAGAALDKTALSLVSTRGTYVSPKIPFAYDYAGKDHDVTDYQGHGTHVAGICAGWSAQVGEEENSINCTFSGAAPAAQILAMKIFYDTIPETDDSIIFQALEDAEKLGADVINLSLGTQNGFTYDESMEKVYGDIYERLSNQGILLNVAAGNEYSMAHGATAGYIGPDYMDYGTVASPSTYPGCTSVASMENKKIYTRALVAEGHQLPYTDSAANAKDQWLTSLGDRTLDYVLLQDAAGGIALGEDADYQKADVRDRIAVVSRGETSFEEKVELAAKHGAVGCIILNNEPGALAMDIKTYEIPAVCMDMEARQAFLSAPRGKIESPRKPLSTDNPLAGEMSEFSNWGPSPDLTIDPAVTGIGGKVYSSGNTGDQAYVVKSGTSMATPNLSGTCALVLNVLNRKMPGADKKVRAQTARDVIESSAQILWDGERIYSVRRQGAGLASSALAAEALETGAYAEAPLKELGDDPEKSGVYSYDVTLKGNSDRDTRYSEIRTFVQTDELTMHERQGQAPAPANAMKEIRLDDSCNIIHTVNGKPATEVTVPQNGEVTVHVEIQLPEELKERLDREYPNGTYIEGFTEFYRKEDGKTVSRTHATFLAFYGDWNGASALEKTDFRDFLRETYHLSQTEEGKDLWAPEYLGCCTMPNEAHAYDSGQDETYATLGKNKLGSVPFEPRHVAVSGNERGENSLSDGLTVTPFLLRNAEKLIFTVTDGKTGEQYNRQEASYVPKAVFDNSDPDFPEWVSSASFAWNGRAADGTLLPDGTVAKVSIDAQLPYSHAVQKDAWTFDVLIDTQAPEISLSYNEDSRVLTVTARDNHFLQGIFLYDGIRYVKREAAVQKTEGEEFTVRFQMKGTEKDLWAYALDYASNTASLPVIFSDENVQRKVVLHTPSAVSTTYAVNNGKIFTFPGCEYQAEGYRFDSWTEEPVDRMPPEEYEKTMVYSEGDQLQIGDDRDFYALYTDGKTYTTAPAVTPPVCHVKNFTDCDRSAWYHEAVDFMVHAGLMKGIGQGLFGPRDSMTRGMMVTVLYRAAGSPKVGSPSGFTDVPGDQWYAEAVAWARENRIVNGVGENRFAPEDNVTREDVATILWRAEGEKITGTDLTAFPDADSITDYAQNAMAWAVDRGILNGDSGCLKPLDFATRAEFAAMFMRYRGGSYACPDLP